MDELTCQKCGKPVILAHIASKYVPEGYILVMDAKPNRDGITLVMNGEAAHLTGEALRGARNAGLPLHTNHSVTCTQHYKRL